MIVPARDEAETLPLLLRDLRAMRGRVHEIIVCDGGSRDATLEVARRGGARVLACDFGNRGAQMNAGARVASGDVFWFLHADARLAPRAATSLHKAFRKNGRGENASTRNAPWQSRCENQLRGPATEVAAGRLKPAGRLRGLGEISEASPRRRTAGAQRLSAATSVAGRCAQFFKRLPYHRCKNAASSLAGMQVIGGNFVLHFDDRRIVVRLFESIARVQRRFGVYYGDSGVFVTREAFRELGGFRAWPLFEDYDFVRRLERLASTRGIKTVCLRPAIRASARRFAKNPAQVLATWTLFQTLFHLGVSPHALAKIYHRKK